MSNHSTSISAAITSSDLLNQISTESWKAELEEKSSRYHITASWVAIIFDPIFGITDYLNIPDGWQQLLIIRFSISVITFTTLMLRKPLKLPSYVIVAIPFFLISLQNAYTFSLIENDGILGHSLNYIALFIGAALFVLWPVSYSLVIVVASVITTTIFVGFNPNLDTSKVIVEGGLLLTVVAIFMIILIQARYNLTVKEIKARLALKKTNELLEEQKAITESKNEKILDSISYAQRIQSAILGHQSHIENWFDDAFVFFKPKDILSGDFYWFYNSEEEDLKVIIAADCTGHGVPAAMMTAMGNAFLNDIVIQRKVYSPEQILYELDKRIIASFSKDSKVNDGMDISIIVFSKGEVSFSGAKNPVYWIGGEESKTIKGSKFPIGSHQFKRPKVFDKQPLSIKEGDLLYIFSDGYSDQFGGEEDRKYLSGRFKKFLNGISHLSMSDQLERLTSEFDSWKGNSPQTDDILIIGLKV